MSTIDEFRSIQDTKIRKLILQGMTYDEEEVQLDCHIVEQNYNISMRKIILSAILNTSYKRIISWNINSPSYTTSTTH
jgi:hypothetical protein